MGEVVISQGFAAPEIGRALLDGIWSRGSFDDLIASDVYSLGKVLQCMISLKSSPEGLDGKALSARSGTNH